MKLVVKIQTHKQYLILSGILGVKNFISRYKKIEEIISEGDGKVLGIRIECNKFDTYRYITNNYSNDFIHYTINEVIKLLDLEWMFEGVNFEKILNS